MELLDPRNIDVEPRPRNEWVATLRQEAAQGVSAVSTSA